MSAKYHIVEGFYGISNRFRDEVTRCSEKLCEDIVRALSSRLENQRYAELSHIVRCIPPFVCNGFSDTELGPNLYCGWVWSHPNFHGRHEDMERKEHKSLDQVSSDYAVQRSVSPFLQRFLDGRVVFLTSSTAGWK